MKKNKLFVLLLTLTFQLGCSKNALFHVNYAGLSKTNRKTHTQRPVLVSPNPNKSNQPTPKQNPDLSNPYVSSRPTLNLTDPIVQSKPIVQPKLSFAPPPPKTMIAQQRTHHIFQDIFPYRWIQKSFYQTVNERNKTTLFFQAFNNYDLNIRDLEKENLHLSENHIEVKNYTLSSERERLDHKLEVVFVIDTAYSMEKYIDIIKNNITHFVRGLREDEIHADLCLVTFRDSVEKICSNFYPDNPLTPQNENALKFLNDISGLKLHKGYNEYRENILGGLLAAAEHTPWNPGNQRMIILATDAFFWEPEPHNSRPEGKVAAAPDYPTVLDALTENNIQVFALAQDYRGFSRKNFRFPSLVEATSGRWFNIKTLEERTIGPIFNHIRDQFNIFYKIEYFVEDQEGLNPSLPLEDRQIDLTINEMWHPIFSYEGVDIQIAGIYSSTPEGAAKLQSSWPLSKVDINKKSLVVTVNGVDKKIDQDFFMEDGKIIFVESPSSGSEISIKYELGELINNIQKHPLILDQKHQPSHEVLNFFLQLNGKEADHSYFEIESANDGSLSLHLKDQVFSDEDPFDIRQLDGLSISLSYETP